jgi:predicted transcriptional regulator
MKEQKREFTGVWIPREIIEDETLTKSEMIIYAEIASFTECRKSNESLGSRWKLKKNTVSIIISSLIKKGFIQSNNKTGEYRKLYANQRGSLKKIKEALSEKSKSLCDKNHTRDNNIDNKEKTINTPTSQKCDVRVPVSMNAEEFYEWTKKSSQAHIRLIGEWADTVKPDLTTKDQWSIYIKRNARIAQSLSVFSMEQIEKAYTEIKKELERLNYTPAMETLLKKLTK